MSLTIEEIRHIAALARVAMTDSEIDSMRSQISDILEHFDVLKKIDTEGVEPTGHSIALHSVVRDDQAEPSCDIEDMLANTPKRDGDFVRVRAVLE